jgi:hypothetical protein
MLLGKSLGVLAGVASALALAAPAWAVAPPDTTAFSTTWVEEHPTATTASDGDLWPQCWSGDDNLYAANGDGRGFGSAGDDIVVNRITGSPAPTNTLAGAELAHGAGVGQVWAGAGYTRKPTGMLCVGGKLYMAVQDLATDFNRAPNATIAVSSDHGSTWSWNTSAPMFSGGTFTTMWFLDYGKDGADNPTPGYVYAYGLDGNWRDSFTNVVPDPTKLYLVRIPVASIQNKATWQWSTGSGTWSAAGDVAARVPVLQDDTRRYPSVWSSNVSNLSVLSQGGVVYDKPLGRYIYTSWTEYTFEFYEAPNPWGPWTRLTSRDFGGYPWTTSKSGGYGTTIPSKFISADGKSMWLQSNVCTCGGGGVANYDFGLRRMAVEPYVPSTPANTRSDSANLATSTAGIRPFLKVAHFGNPGYLNDGNLSASEDDWNDENKGSTWWGYVWPREYNLNKVVYRTGQVFGDGGWFASGLRVQVRRNGVWSDVSDQAVSPAYPYSSAAGAFTNYTFTFADTRGDGVRIIGAPGGTRTFSSISELSVYYGTGNVAGDSGFEAQPSGTVSAPWSGEGPDAKGIDNGLGLQHSGSHNAWIHPTAVATTAFNAVKQTVNVVPNTNYVLHGWVQTSANVTGGYFGVRNGTSSTVLAETHPGPSAAYTPLTVSFNSGSNTQVTLYGGYWGPGADSWMRLDDVTLRRA